MGEGVLENDFNPGHKHETQKVFGFSNKINMINEPVFFLKKKRKKQPENRIF